MTFAVRGSDPVGQWPEADILTHHSAVWHISSQRADVGVRLKHSKAEEGASMGASIIRI